MQVQRDLLPVGELAALRRAITLGRIDFWVAKGWANPEEWLYPQVQEALTAWTIAHRPGHLVYRIVGEQWAPRSHELRDALACNGVPLAASTAGRLPRPVLACPPERMSRLRP